MQEASRARELCRRLLRQLPLKAQVVGRRLRASAEHLRRLLVRALNLTEPEPLALAASALSTPAHRQAELQEFQCAQNERVCSRKATCEAQRLSLPRVHRLPLEQLALQRRLG